MVNLRYYFIACAVAPKDRAANYGGNTCKIATRVAVRKAMLLEPIRCFIVLACALEINVTEQVLSARHEVIRSTSVVKASSRSFMPGLKTYTPVTHKLFKRKWIYIAPLLKYLTLKALRYRSHSVTCKLHRTCLYLVSIHQMAHPQTEVADI